MSPYLDLIAQYYIQDNILSSQHIFNSMLSLKDILKITKYLSRDFVIIFIIIRKNTFEIKSEENWRKNRKKTCWNNWVRKLLPFLYELQLQVSRHNISRCVSYRKYSPLSLFISLYSVSLFLKTLYISIIEKEREREIGERDG